MGTEHFRNLPVPFFSQRKNTYIYEGVYTKAQAEKLKNNSLTGKKYKVCHSWRANKIETRKRTDKIVRNILESKSSLLSKMK